MEKTAKNLTYCRGCKNDAKNRFNPGCEFLAKAEPAEKSMYPYAPHYEDKVTLKTYNCYIRDYITPFPRDLDVNWPVRNKLN